MYINNVDQLVCASNTHDICKSDNKQRETLFAIDALHIIIASRTLIFCTV